MLKFYIYSLIWMCVICCFSIRRLHTLEKLFSWTYKQEALEEKSSLVRNLYGWLFKKSGRSYRVLNLFRWIIAGFFFVFLVFFIFAIIFNDPDVDQLYYFVFWSLFSILIFLGVLIILVKEFHNHCSNHTWYHLIYLPWKKRKNEGSHCRINDKFMTIALDLEKSMGKYCYTKEKGIYYILEKDLDRIRTTELKKYKYACEKTEYDEKGQEYFVVYDEYHQREIFRAPIK